MYAWKTIARPWQYSAVGTVGHPGFPDQVSVNSQEGIGDAALALNGAGDTPDATDSDSGGDGAGTTKTVTEHEKSVKQEPNMLTQQELDEMTAKCQAARQGEPVAGQYEQIPKKRPVSPAEPRNNKPAKKMKTPNWDFN